MTFLLVKIKLPLMFNRFCIVVHTWLFWVMWFKAKRYIQPSENVLLTWIVSYFGYIKIVVLLWSFCSKVFNINNVFVNVLPLRLLKNFPMLWVAHEIFATSLNQKNVELRGKTLHYQLIWKTWKQQMSCKGVQK